MLVRDQSAITNHRWRQETKDHLHWRSKKARRNEWVGDNRCWIAIGLQLRCYYGRYPLHQAYRCIKRQISRLGRSSFGLDVSKVFLVESPAKLGYATAHCSCRERKDALSLQVHDISMRIDWNSMKTGDICSEYSVRGLM